MCLQEQKLEASELQHVYEQLTQREARLKASQAAAAADAEELRADMATREAAAAAKLRAAEEMAARLQSQREQAEKSKCAHAPSHGTEPNERLHMSCCKHNCWE